MKAYTIIAAVALTAIVFASPALAASSVASSTEKGFSENPVRGYFAETSVPAADVGHSIEQSRENGGSPHALNKSRGLGLGTAGVVEKSREKGW